MLNFNKFYLFIKSFITLRFCINEFEKKSSAPWKTMTNEMIFVSITVTLSLVSTTRLIFFQIHL
jgi:hypothetical protein